MTGKDIAPIEGLIVTIRGSRVILAADLAGIYGVQTRALNQAVKRNLEKFPEDFVFQLILEEAETVQRSRSQIVILKRGLNIKYLPCAFTERGACAARHPSNIPRPFWGEGQGEGGAVIRGLTGRDFGRGRGGEG